MTFTSRLASPADAQALAVVMEAAIAQLQSELLDESQIESSRAIMGIDDRLIEDGTYFVIEDGGEIAGCGGWSRRATLYGGSRMPGRDERLLSPGVEAARVRAMYTNPAFTRRGVGRLVLALCEEAAAAEGFTELELMATVSGERLYTSCGFVTTEHVEDATGGVPVPLVKMVKSIAPLASGEDFEYDLAHEAVPHEGEDVAAPGDHPSATVSSVATETPGYSGDYGYDLSHDIPRATR